MSSNKSIKNRMIAKYGAECWIDKLHLRSETNRRYKSKSQMKRMRQLTYHHIKEKSKGGRATEENGALLSVENHEWFNKQPKEVQDKLNEIFQEYKRRFNQGDTTSLDIAKPITLEYDKFVSLAKQRYNRAKNKRKTQEIIDEELYM